MCGEDTATKLGITREECDAYALEVKHQSNLWFGAVQQCQLLACLGMVNVLCRGLLRHGSWML